MNEKSKTPIHHLIIDQNYRLSANVDVYSRKMAVLTVDQIDSEIMANIKKIAEKHNITDVLILDEEFIITALKNEVKRRNTLEEIHE